MTELRVLNTATKPIIRKMIDQSVLISGSAAAGFMCAGTCGKAGGGAAFLISKIHAMTATPIKTIIKVVILYARVMFCKGLKEFPRRDRKK